MSLIPITFLFLTTIITLTSLPFTNGQLTSKPEDIPYDNCQAPQLKRFCLGVKKNIFDAALEGQGCLVTRDCDAVIYAEDTDKKTTTEHDTYWYIYGRRKEPETSVLFFVEGVARARNENDDFPNLYGKLPLYSIVSGGEFKNNRTYFVSGIRVQEHPKSTVQKFTEFQKEAAFAETFEYNRSSTTGSHWMQSFTSRQRIVYQPASGNWGHDVNLEGDTYPNLFLRIDNENFDHEEIGPIKMFGRKVEPPTTTGKPETTTGSEDTGSSATGLGLATVVGLMAIGVLMIN